MQLSRRTLVSIGASALVVGLTIGVLTRDGDDESRVAAVDTTSTVPTTETTAPSSTTASTTTTAPVTTTTTGSPNPTTTVAPAPPFEAAISTVSALDLGTSWRPGCPVAPEQLRAIDASFWGYDDTAQRGRIIVHADQADAIAGVLRSIYDARFPIQRMAPVDAYGSDDQASMRANNTSGFNCRYVGGTTNWSEHAFGRAIDVNPLVNPYVKGSSTDPPEGAPYRDRSRNDKGMIHDGDAAVRAFAAHGWGWGGHWSGGKDYQHFSASGR